MNIDLIDGTYELYRQFFGLRRFNQGEDRPYGAVVGVLNSVLEMIERDVTHVGVATDHVIESFRNDLWPGYKTGEGIEPALLAQFHPLEESLAAMGVAVWPMVELEADDALATAARLADEDERVELVHIWTPDKDLAQCVRDNRVLQVDRKTKKVRGAVEVREKFGVLPQLIPIKGIGAVGAARLLNEHGAIEDFPASVLGEQRDAALLFKRLATLRTDAKLFGDVEELRWMGPTASFAEWTKRMGAPKLLDRSLKVLSRKLVKSSATPTES
ncbi:hypothetical protein [Caenimonas koreensis]|uniref:5'-3' exonuclease n=1 Tax=Caenimonas koreensis TaxID=367474 RepID=UPI0037840E48